MKWILFIGAAGGGYFYLRSQGIDLSTGEGWSALAVKFGAKPCNCNQALPTAAGSPNTSTIPGVAPQSNLPASIGGV